MIITLRQMQYVVAVAETGSFSKAAELCAADQSTVSQQVKLFEERLAVTIFDRETLPIGITEAGTLVVDQARQILDAVENLIKPIKPSPNRFG